MCQAVTCRKCGRTTWAGCGNHVDQVMRTVPVSDRCTCDREAPAGERAGSGGGWLGRVFGR